MEGGREGVTTEHNISYSELEQEPFFGDGYVRRLTRLPTVVGIVPLNEFPLTEMYSA